MKKLILIIFLLYGYICFAQVTPIADFRLYGALAANNVWVGQTFTSNTIFTQSALGQASANSISLVNPTAAALNAQQYSPALMFGGYGWSTGAGASQSSNAQIYLQPTQGTASGAQINIGFATAGAGTYTNAFSMNSGGVLNSIGMFQTNQVISTTSTDGFVNSNPQAASAGVPVRYSTRNRWTGTAWNTTTTTSNQQDAIMELRPISGAATGAVLALAFQNTGGGYVDRVTFDNNGGLTGILKPAVKVQSATGTTADSIVFSNGQSLVKKALVAGAGVSLAQTATVLTVTNTGNPIVEISGTSQSAAGNTIYIPHNAALTTITIPSTTVIGTLYQVIGEGAGGWKLQLPAGYTAVGVGSFTTTSGGSLNSTDKNCTITIRLTNTNKFTGTTSQGTINPL